MEEPFDELVGSSAEKKMENLMSATAKTKSNSAPPPNAFRASPTTTPPPTNAFGHGPSRSSSERWDTSMAKLRAESALESSRAAGRASASRHSLPPSAAYKFRRSQSDASSHSTSRSRRTYDWREEDGMDDPQDEALKKALDDVDSNLASKYNVRRTADGSFRTDAPYVVRRTDSGRIVSESTDPGAPFAVSRTASGTITAGETSSSKRRVPAALSGLGFMDGGSSKRSDSAAAAAIKGRFSFKDRNFMSDDVLDDEDYEDYVEDEDDVIVRDEKEVVNVGSMQARAARTMAALTEDDSEDEKKASTWSSRYSINKTLLALQGGMSGNDILRDMDRDAERNRMSARNMFASSAHNMKAMVSQEKGKVFGSGFSFRQSNVFGKQHQGQTNLHTQWKDIDMGEGSLPPPPPIHKTWQQALLTKQKRRRYVVVGALLFMAVVLVTVTTLSAAKRKNGSSLLQAQGSRQGSGVTFFVTSNVPYDQTEEEKLTKDLMNIPGDAEFVVHLGNIQDSSVSLCPRSRYNDVASLLQKSTLPMFVLPGEHDWVRCPYPDIALELWRENFEEFENKVAHNLVVMRNSERGETFSILHKGVLFFGLHLVNGPIDPDILKAIQDDTLRFFYGMLNLNKDQFRAIVIFGNARPSPMHDGIFGPVLEAVDGLKLPSAYIHASNDGVIEQYTPFESHNMLGVQVEDGGRNPPLKINVAFGKRPFLIG